MSAIKANIKPVWSCNRPVLVVRGILPAHFTHRCLTCSLHLHWATQILVDTPVFFVACSMHSASGLTRKQSVSVDLSSIFCADILQSAQSGARNDDDFGKLHFFDGICRVRRYLRTSATGNVTKSHLTVPVKNRPFFNFKVTPVPQWSNKNCFT